MRGFLVICLAVIFSVGSLDAEAKSRGKGIKRLSHAHRSVKHRTPKVHLHVSPRVTLAPRVSRPVAAPASTPPAAPAQRSAPLPLAQPAQPAAAAASPPVNAAPPRAAAQPLPPGLVFPPGAVALCQDGSFATDAPSTGVCSGKGGVRNWR